MKHTVLFNWGLCSLNFYAYSLRDDHSMGDKDAHMTDLEDSAAAATCICSAQCSKADRTSEHDDRTCCKDKP